MKVFTDYHPSYITILPSISIGKDWVILDWIFYSIEIQF